MKATQLYLYHGTDVVIDAPKWDHGSRYRDFGHCFYTTHSREMATDWAEKRSLLYPVVNCYVVNFKDLQTGTLKVKRFKADAEWAEFIYNNRYNRHYRRPDYDIIIGPVADKGLSEQMAKARREGKTFVASKTYKRLLTDEDLQEEGSLFIIELLEKELTEQREERQSSL